MSNQRRAADLATLIAYAFEDDSYHRSADRFFEKAESEGSAVYISPTVAIEAEALLLSGRIKVALEEWLSFIDAILANPRLEKVPLTRDLFTAHRGLYRGYGGRHTYFDSFHAALAVMLNAPLVTSDEVLLRDKAIPTEDLRRY